ncbi:serine hydrolase [Cochleicola gelatinilyticus]|uniref:Serine hydrolase n=1 Tax=Cochleicola gelatinilyticus TaxID=1763537 RepID=A0A167J950_9FLAO|nr:serine hydrolase [Cochleicola gelatinilyticus]OAB80444.1 serine hydrolase [Cochleicola gelatinilyticus]
MKSQKTFLRKSVALMAMAFMLVSIVSFGQTKVQELDALLGLYTQYGQFNGSVLVAEKGKVVYKKGFGLANMEWDIPNTPDTKHRIGSITKQFTALLIMQLVAEGKIELQAPVSKYLPEYSKTNGDKITIHQLLTHTSGVPNYTSFPNFFKDLSRNPHTTNEMVRLFADSTLQFTPGTKFTYSNSGYVLLGAIIEKITGKLYEQVLREKIFNPLAMNNTGFDHHNSILKKRASGYQKKGSTFENAPYIDMSTPHAAGSLYSTVEDLYKWDQALYTEKLLPKNYMDMMYQAYIPAFGQHYGYGWSVGKMEIGTSKDSVQVIGHSGGINGFNTLITRMPNEKSSVILLDNTGDGELNDITIAIAGILYNKAYELPKESLASKMYSTILDKDLQAGLAFFEKHKNSEDYVLKESDMNSIGYSLLRSDKLNEAEAVFKLNVAQFPKSSNVYDSYGEVLMNLGKNDLAIANYKKSIELNSANENGIDMLKKLGVETNNLIPEVKVPETILEEYVGRYELMPGFILTVTKEGTQLKTQATGQSQVDVFPKSNTVFYLKVVAAQITFNQNEAGKTESLTLLQGGQEITGKKLPE